MHSACLVDTPAIQTTQMHIMASSCSHCWSVLQGLSPARWRWPQNSPLLPACPSGWVRFPPPLRGWALAAASWASWACPGFSFQHLKRKRKKEKICKVCPDTCEDFEVVIILFFYVVWHIGSWGRGVLRCCSSVEDGKKMAIKKALCYFKFE